MINFAAFNKMMEKLNVYSSFVLMNSFLHGQDESGETLVSDTAHYLEEMAVSPNNQFVVMGWQSFSLLDLSSEELQKSDQH